jgi:trigger factor
MGSSPRGHGWAPAHWQKGPENVMQVNVQRLSPVLVEFAVEIPETQVRQEVERAYRELSKTAKVRGYRPGKAPRDVLVHVYGGQVSANVTQRLIDNTLQQALNQQAVTPLATLSIAPARLSPTAAFSYKARFEVSPDISEVKYEGFQVKRPSTAVSDDQIAQELERLRREHATLRAPEPARPAQATDQVIIDFTLSIDGTLYPEGAGSDIEADIGSGRLVKELEDGLVGLSIGDKKDIAFTFSQSQRADLRGKQGTFHVTVKEVKERVLPELDDDFAKDVGEFENLDALRADVKGKITKALNQRAEDAVAEQLVFELCKANIVPAPPSLVQRQLEISEQELAAEARSRGQRLQMDAQSREILQRDAEMKVRAGLLMAAIARANNMTVNDQDIERAYVELAEQTGKNVARLKVEYRDAKKREILIGMILEDKILDIIEAKANVTSEGEGEAAKGETEAPKAAEVEAAKP